MAALSEAVAMRSQLGSYFVLRHPMEVPLPAVFSVSERAPTRGPISSRATVATSPPKRRPLKKPQTPKMPLQMSVPLQNLANAGELACAAVACEVPSTISWQFELDRKVDAIAEGAHSSTISDFLKVDLDDQLAWQRSMLETHWLLDSQNPDVEPHFDSPVLSKPRRRARKTKASNLSVASEIPKPEPRVVVRSEMSARARRHSSRTSRGDTIIASAASVPVLAPYQAPAPATDLSTVSEPKASVPVHANAETSLDLDRTSPANNEVESDLRDLDNSTWRQHHYKEGGTNFVSTFMNEIGRARLLTREEEVQLASRLQSAVELRESKERSSEEQGREISYNEWARASGLTVTELRRRLRDGDTARERLIAANMRLVVSVVKKYTRHDVQICDLVTAGTVGLAKGVDRFDPSRGFKLSTYVHWWIRQAVTRAAAEYTGVIRLPMHVRETMAKVKKVNAKFMAQGETPSQSSLAAALGMSEKRVSRVQKLKVSTKSLDESVRSPTGFTDGASFHNFVFDPEEESRAWGSVENSFLKKDVAQSLLSKLDRREREIVCLHYGLGSKEGVGMTLDNISLRFGVSRERIRQVETVAMRKLRVLSERKDLQRYCY